MTQLEAAKKGEITEAMLAVAEDEGTEPEEIRDSVAAGVVVIPKNHHHNFRPRGIGAGLRTKINANIGYSAHHKDQKEEIDKLDISVKAGADAVMDLSTGDDLDEVRLALLKRCPVMMGTVPIYQVISEKGIEDFSTEDVFEVIERQAKQGVDFITVHCGVTKESLDRLLDQGRVCGIVSRGGSVMASWICRTGEENPLYAGYDRLLEVALEHDVTLSLGDGLRPGAIHDASDNAQFSELKILGELAGRARDRGVQVMIEGPGHVPLDEIEANVELEKKLCGGAPFYVLGPLTTDVAPGYDHITSAIGGAIAASCGADFLCYVTRAEHLRLPTVEDVREGVIAARIAAHTADIVKGVKGAKDWDLSMSAARKALDWEKMYSLAIDPERAREMRAESEAYEDAVCTMCGPLCAIDMDNAMKRRLEKSRTK
jgi:phosphomethylpyrimidine synthase